MIDPQVLGKAANLFVDAGFDGGDMVAPLEALTQALNGTCAAIIPVTNRTPGPFPYTGSSDDALKSYVRDGWYQNDARMATLPSLLRNRLATDQDFIDAEGMKRLSYYQEFLRPHKLQWFMGIGLKIDHEIWTANIQRSPQQGLFTKEEQAAVLRIQKTISHGASLAVEIKRAALKGIASFYETFEQPIVLLDRAGDVTQVNRAAESLLARGLAIKNRRLKISGPDNADLEKFVAALVSFEDPVPELASNAFLARRLSGRPLIFSGQRLQIGKAWDYFAQSRALVMINDPDRRPRAKPELLVEMFKLTHSEAKICVALFDLDGDVRRVSDQLSVTYSTVRTYLKSVYSKMGISSQGELLLIIARVFERRALNNFGPNV